MSEGGSRRGVALVIAGFCTVALIAVPAAVIASSRMDRSTGSLEPLEAAEASAGVQPSLRRSDGLPDGLALPELQVSSALVSSQEPLRSGAQPAKIRIDAIGVRAPIVAVGVTGDTTEVPQDVDTVGWFRFAGRPGSPGSTLLLAHVSSGAQGPGAFYRLRELQVDDEIEVSLTDGVTVTYRVVARRMHLKEELPGRIYDRAGRSVLTLVTCGGAYLQETGRFQENVVVYALPVR